MLLEDLSEVCDMFKGSFPISLIFFIPILIILSPANPVCGAHDFSVFRMQQFDLQGSSFGSKSAAINVEARPVDAKVYTRRCILTKLTEFTIDKYREMVSQNAAGVVVLLPSSVELLTPEQKQEFKQVEQDLLQEETLVPVYFAEESETLLEIEQDVRDSVNSDQASSGAEALLGAASANGFQLVTSAVQSKAMSDFQITNIQGKLSGSGIEEQLPTIAIVAHYDAFGIAPTLARGADSNASGVAALIELARLFAKLYTNSRTHAKFNLLFLLSGAGKFNYQGTKRWIEDQLESTENSLLPDAAFVLCLDSIGSGDGLYLHVSKPPKAGSEGATLLQNLKQTSGQFFPDSQFDSVHKKINLAEDYFAWEHERFSMRRLAAFTLSHHASHTDSVSSILDTRQNADPAVIARNVKIVSEALARRIFNLSSDANFDIFSEGLRVEEESITAWLDYLTSEPRSAQLLGKDSALLSALEQAFSRYLKDVHRHAFKADKRDPEFVFYDLPETTMSAYNVKPAVFDLFLAVAIASYLGVLFLFVQNFGTVYALMKKIGSPVKAKAN